jgi:hypothetical protein
VALLFAAAVASLQAHNADVKPVTFKGADALEIRPHSHDGVRSGLAVLPCAAFHDGTIELEAAGDVAPDADAGARGFIGIAFRLKDSDTYEAFYLRPTNGRANDQLRRNHSLQYISPPEYPWERLRKETPGIYEAYADLQPGVWTKMRVVVKGNHAQLFVNGAEQPALIVNELKHGDSTGGVAYWVGPGTIGHFRGLKVTAALH